MRLFWYRACTGCLVVSVSVRVTVTECLTESDRLGMHAHARVRMCVCGGKVLSSDDTRMLSRRPFFGIVWNVRGGAQATPRIERALVCAYFFLKNLISSFPVVLEFVSAQ
jgi:hypothetical protein